MKLVGTRPIHTDRLVLRRWSVDDAQQMYDNLASDTEATRFVTWPPHPNVDATRLLLTGWVRGYDDPATFNWAVWLDEVIIGQIAVVDVDTRVNLAELGYCLGKRWWNHGYATETVKAVMSYLLDTAQVNKVEARHDPANIASGRVMENAGMVIEGLRRACVMDSCGPRDSQYHGRCAANGEASRLMTDRREVTCRRWRATFLVLASLASLTWAFAGVLNPAMSQLHAFVSEYSARDQPWRYLFQTTDVIMGTLLCLAGLATLVWARHRPSDVRDGRESASLQEGSSVSSMPWLRWTALPLVPKRAWLLKRPDTSV